jgi:O-antigen ligase
MAESCSPRAVLAKPSQRTSSRSFARMPAPIAYGQQRTANLRARREEIFRKAAFFFLWMLLFVIPWEHGVVINGFGTISRVVGIPAFGMALLAILECGTVRMPGAQQIIMLAFVIWGGFTYFWSLSPETTATSIYTFVQLFMMVWLIWEFAQTRREQMLLLRAYVLGSIVSAVATLSGLFNSAGLQGGRDSSLGFNPGDLAFILALAIPISLYLAAQERRKILVWVDGATGILAFCAIVLTTSRSLIVACMPTLIMFPFLFAKLRWSRNLLVLVFVAVAGIGWWLFMPESSWSRLSAIGSDLSSGTLEQRATIRQIGWQISRKAPFRGIGAGAYVPSIEHRLGWESDVGGEADYQVARLVAPNTFLSILAEQGVIGFALFFALLLSLVLSAWKLPGVDRIFWLCMLLTWSIGAFDLTWAERKPTWFIFGLLMNVTATQLTVKSRSSRSEILAGQHPEMYAQAALPTEASGSQGLS